MILSYMDILGDGKRHRMKAKVTTEHSLSSYGQPVVLIEDGQPLGLDSWVLLGYQIVQATPAEFELMKKYISLISLMVDVDDSSAAAKLGRKGGLVTSDAKTEANRAKANLPQKEGKKPRGRPSSKTK